MRRQGFPRSCRLTERPQFTRLFERPSTYRAPTFQAFWKANGKKTARLGITIKGRLSSVWRTRLKRVVREWFRLVREESEAVDLNVVIRVSKELDMAFLDALKRDLRHWKK